MESKRIVVTGGMGHIGSKLVRSIPEHTNIIIVDNLSTQRWCSFAGLPRYIKFINSDFSNLDLYKDADYIIHLAGTTDASGSMNNSNLVYENNFMSIKPLIDNMKDNQVIVFPSTTSVYGKSADWVYENDSTVLNPQSPYAESKILAEEYIRNSGKKYFIFRFGTIFGTSPGMRFHTAINKFCLQAFLREKITVWRQNIDMPRPYLGLGDCIRTIKAAIESFIPMNETYNVVSENAVLKDIIALLDQNFNGVKIDYVDSPLLNQHSYKVSPDKIRPYIKFVNDVASGIFQTREYLMSGVII